MELCEYFERIFPSTDSKMYHPNRKNKGIFVSFCFSSAGSTYFSKRNNRQVTSEDVQLERKLYSGARPLSKDVKNSFPAFNEDGLACYFKSFIEDGKYPDVMLNFGIPNTGMIRKDCLCKALARQFRAFIDSDTKEADDIVLLEYQRFLSAPESHKCESCQPVSVLYPGDRVYIKPNSQSRHNVNIYEEFHHTWEFENTGTQTWRGRKLCFSNCGEVRPRTRQNSIDIPDTPPNKSVKISVESDARGFEGRSVCKWIMIDSEGGNCFPGSSMFDIEINAEFVEAC